MKNLILLIIFSISAYAQLVGTTKGKFLVEQGNVKYILNIPTPKGVGIKPKISITYNSSSKKNNGYLGQGFKLDFMSAVTIGDKENEYYLNDEKLIPISTFSLRTEKDTFSKIISDVTVYDSGNYINYVPNKLDIYTKDGLIKKYGTGSNSKLNGKFYALSNISDRLGNEIVYDYDSENKLVNISYANTIINFIYEDRDDQQNKSYKDFVFNDTSKRLKNIVISTEEQEVSTYTFTYTYINNESYISTIEECVEDNCKEPLLFTWNNNDKAQATLITNNKNEYTSITYENLQNSSIYTITSESTDDTKYYTYPNISVVKSYKTLDPNGTKNHNVSFKYEDFATNTERGILGFAKIKKTLNSNYQVIETNYYQNYPYIGKIKDSTFYAKNKKYTYLENTYNDVNNDYDAVYNPQLVTSILKTYDINNSDELLKTRTLENLEFDIFGNSKKIIDTTLGSDGSSSTKTIIKTFSNDFISWNIGKTTKETTTYSKNSAADITTVNSYSYYDNGLLKDKIIEPDNQSLQLTTHYDYNEYGNLIKKTVSGNNITSRVMTYDYDSNNINKISETDSKGYVTSRNYDYKNQLKYMITPDGLKTTYTYDSFGTKIKETNPTGIYTTWDYSWTEDGYKIIEKINDKFPETTYYNNVGKKTKTEKIGFDGRKIYQDFSYNIIFGKIYSESIPYFESTRPKYTITTYDAIGRILKIVEPSKTNVPVPSMNDNENVEKILENIEESYNTSVTTTNVYNGFNITSTNGRGNIKTTTIDILNNVIKVVDDLTQIIYKYDSRGNLLSTTDSKNNTISMTYDIRGNKINMNDPDMGYWEYKYNALGELIWQKDAKGQITEFEYDTLGRKVLKKENDEIVGQWVFDSSNGETSLGNLISEISKTENKIYSYDTYGRLIKESTKLDDIESALIKQYTYNSDGQLNYKELPNGIKLFNQYNQYGYLEAIKSEKPTITDAEQTEFNANAQLALEMELTYYQKYLDILDQINIYQKLINSYKESYSSEEFLELINELEGYVSEYHLQAKVYYEKSQQYYEEYMEEISLNNNNYFEAMMDARGIWNSYLKYKNLAEEYIQKGKDEDTDLYTNEIVNLKNKLSTLKELYLNQTQYTNEKDIYKISDSTYNYHIKVLERNSYGVPTKYIYGNGVITNENYDDRGLLLSSKSGYEEDDDIIRSLEYEYDVNKNIKIRNDKRLAVIQNYLYDSLDRVTDVYIDTRGNSSHLEYTYDEIGNLTYKSGLGNYSYKTNGSTKPHAVSEIDDNIFTYDENGNMLSGNNKTITYSISNKPITIKEGSLTINFEYDLNNEKIKKSSSNEITYYLGDDFEIIKNGSIKVEKTYIYLNGNAISIYSKKTSSSTSFESEYLHYDNLGSVDSITNNLGVITERMAYKPFGERLALDKFGDNSSDNISLDIGFTGHKHINEVNLIHMNGRIYDPSLGKFISADPNIPYVFDSQSFNRYSYTRNNPLKYIDPSGYSDKSSSVTIWGDEWDSWRWDVDWNIITWGSSSVSSPINGGTSNTSKKTEEEEKQEKEIISLGSETIIAYEDDDSTFKIKPNEFVVTEASFVTPFFALARTLIKVIKPKKLKYKDSTKPRSLKNYDINANRKQVEESLRINGYKEKFAEKKISYYEKGKHKFTIRDFSNSEGPTVDYKNLETEFTTKIRLKGE